MEAPGAPGAPGEADAPAGTAAEAAAARKAGRSTEGLIAADPRTWRLGYRVYLDASLWDASSRGPPEGPPLAPLPPQPRSDPVNPAGMTEMPAAATAATAASLQEQGRAYEVYRHLAGVCEGPREVGIGEQMPLALNFDFLRLACSHNKGCFVGQEVLTRALHQLSNRRRLALLLPKGPQGAPTEAPIDQPLGGADDSLGAWVPRGVMADWEGALSAAVRRLTEGPLQKKGPPTEQPVAAGDRIYRRAPPTADGAPGEWKEIGVVVIYDEEAGGGICLLRSRPGDGAPLKTPQVIP